MVSQQRTSALSTTFENPPAMEIWNPNRMVWRVRRSCPLFRRKTKTFYHTTFS
jgi:hypothetical protein